MIKIDQEPQTEGAYYDAVWDKEFETRPWKYDTTRHTALLKNLKSGMSLVDLAAGVYGSAQFVAEILDIKNVRLVALDCSLRAKEMVEAMCPRIDYRTGTLPQTSFADAEFDYVVATQIIEHQTEPDRLIAEIARICKIGGWMAMAVHDKNNPAVIQRGIGHGQLWWMDGKDLIEMSKPYGECELKTIGHYCIVWCRRS